MDRPYSQETTASLDTIFRENSSDVVYLRSLAHELRYRKRPKARALLQRVEDALRKLSIRGDAAAIDKECPVTPPKCQSPHSKLVPDMVSAANRVKRSKAPIGQQAGAGERESSTVSQPFRLVRGRGAAGCPQAFDFPPRTDITLACKNADSRAKRFSIALRAHIEELQQSDNSWQHFSLVKGQRVAAEEGEFTYAFSFGDEPAVFEGAEIVLVFGGRRLPGRVLEAAAGRLVLSVEEDLGESIEHSVLRVDDTALLRALADRMDVVESGAAAEFDVSRATRLLINEPLRTTVVGRAWPWEGEPTSGQLEFLHKAVGHDLIWLWGPPGTGKTATLSALVKCLLDDEERVLVCSNTHKAVDQLLLKMCKNLEASNKVILNDGNIVRLGKPSDVLNEHSGEGVPYVNFVDPAAIAARRSIALSQKKISLLDIKHRTEKSISEESDSLRLFGVLDERRASLSVCEQKVLSGRTALAQARDYATAGQTFQCTLMQELKNVRGAGVFRRLLMRDATTIEADIEACKRRIADDTTKVAKAEESLREVEQSAMVEAQQYEAACRSVADLNRASLESALASHHRELDRVKVELAKVDRDLDEVSKGVIKDAKIIGATVTHVLKNSSRLGEFDTVVIDEASMVLLPAVFNAAGLARNRVVVAGDFKQLPPILKSEQLSIRSEIGQDVFEAAGVNERAVNDKLSSNIVMLREQFRMDRAICGLVSDAFYGSSLVTHPSRPTTPWRYPLPLRDSVTIIDTSRIFPTCSRDRRRSRFNLLHAAVVRGLALHLSASGVLNDRSQFGVCTPFKAQADLLEKVVDDPHLSHLQIRAGTVHSFQGDEQDLVVLDLVDSNWQRHSGMFLQASSQEAQGAKLLNVAMSRAKDAIVVIADLTFLDRKLPGDAILRDILCRIQQTGHVLDAAEVLALCASSDERRMPCNDGGMAEKSLDPGLCRGEEFESICYKDIRLAKNSVLIFSGFATADRVIRIKEVLELKVREGVNVRCVTRPPDDNGSISVESGMLALTLLRECGVALDLRQGLHEKLVIVDERIVWVGSLNPLSHSYRTSEVMLRIDNANLAKHLCSVTSIGRRGALRSVGGSANGEENPRCKICGDLSVYKVSKFGAYFECLRRDGWKMKCE